MKKIVVYAILLLIHVCMVYAVHVVGSQFYRSRIEQNKTVPKVFDIGEKYLPDWHDRKMLIRMMDLLSFAFPLAFGLKIAIEHASFMVTIFMVRHIFTFVTILPKHKKCDDTKFGINQLLFGHCYDKIFSGHFSSIVILACILYTKGIVPLHILAVFVFIYGCLLVSIRYHYTVDILVALIVSIAIYQNDLKLVVK